MIWSLKSAGALAALAFASGIFVATPVVAATNDDDVEDAIAIPGQIDKTADEVADSDQDDSDDVESEDSGDEVASAADDDEPNAEGDEDTDSEPAAENESDDSAGDEGDSDSEGGSEDAGSSEGE